MIHTIHDFNMQDQKYHFRESIRDIGRKNNRLIITFIVKDSYLEYESKCIFFFTKVNYFSDFE